jgi:hypothetical protein
MVAESTDRCENLACLCEVPSGDAGCSAYCASPDGLDPQNVLCACGHDVCARAIEQQLHGEAGRESA